MLLDVLKASFTHRMLLDELKAPFTCSMVDVLKVRFSGASSMLLDALLHLDLGDTPALISGNLIAILGAQMKLQACNQVMFTC